MKLKCSNKKCGYEWDYNGTNPFYACCSRCKTSVNIEKNNKKTLLCYDESESYKKGKEALSRLRFRN